MMMLRIKSNSQRNQTNILYLLSFDMCQPPNKLQHFNETNQTYAHEQT